MPLFFFATECGQSVLSDSYRSASVLLTFVE